MLPEADGCGDLYTDTEGDAYDGTGTDVGDTSHSHVSDNAAEARPNENSAPTFGDDESVDRSVAENAKGENVGDPVTANDGDELPDALLYTLSGDGSDAFKVDRTTGR